MEKPKLFTFASEYEFLSFPHQAEERLFMKEMGKKEVESLSRLCQFSYFEWICWNLKIKFLRAGEKMQPTVTFQARI